MTYTVRWPKLGRWRAAAWVCALVLAVLSSNVVLALVVLAAWMTFMVRDVRVRAWGGGFRPLRQRELLDFAAVDELDAFDREQAMLAAKARR